MVELCYFVCRMKWLLSDHESLEIIQPLFINMYLSIVVSGNHGNSFQVHESNRLSDYIILNKKDKHSKWRLQ